MKSISMLLTLFASAPFAVNLLAAGQPAAAIGQNSDPTEEPAEELLKGLSLTGAQKEQIAELRKEYRPKILAARQAAAANSPEAVHPRVETEFRQSLVNLLTNEQRIKLVQLRRQAASEKSRPSQPEKETPKPKWGPVVEPAVAGPINDSDPGSKDPAAPRDQAAGRSLASDACGNPIGGRLAGRPDLVPDGRAGRQTGPIPRAVRAVVEREFAQSSPQLQGVKFVFFETAGDKPKRVWVMCRQSPVLLGYDGSRWIERRITNGVLPERFDNCPSFWQLDDAVVFLDTTGCQVLRGDKWIYQRFLQRSDNGIERRVWPDPDGKGFTVMIDDRPVTQSTQVWHYRDGNWKDVPWGQRQSAVKLGDCFYQVLNRNSKAIIAAFAAHGRTPPAPGDCEQDRNGRDGQATRSGPGRQAGALQHFARLRHGDRLRGHRLCAVRRSLAGDAEAGTGRLGLPSIGKGLLRAVEGRHGVDPPRLHVLEGLGRRQAGLAFGHFVRHAEADAGRSFAGGRPQRDRRHGRLRLRPAHDGHLHRRDGTAHGLPSARERHAEGARWGPIAPA